MGFGTQRAIVDLMRRVELEIGGVRIGGDDSWNPLLIFPVPAGYFGWVAFRGGTYIAFVSRRTAPEQVWHREVGRRREDLGQVWARISTFFGEVLPAPDAPAPVPSPNAPAPPKVVPTNVGPSIPSAGARAGLPGGAHFTLDLVNYPEFPSVELLENAVGGLRAMFAEGSEPTVVAGSRGPTLTLTTHEYERFVVFGVHNSLVATVYSADERGEPFARRGPYMLDCEFVHEPVSATLMIGAEFISVLEEARDNDSLPLQLRADLESEAVTARIVGASMFLQFTQAADEKPPGDLQRRARWAIEPLRQAYYLADPAGGQLERKRVKFDGTKEIIFERVDGGAVVVKARGFGGQPDPAIVSEARARLRKHQLSRGETPWF